VIALKNVLVATDFGEAADKALVYAKALATRFGAHLHVLHVSNSIYLAALGAEAYAAMSPDLQARLEEDARRELDARVVDSDSRGPATTRTIITSSSPALTIVDYAKDHDIDLIVLGTHGRGTIGQILMGSVAERVVRTAPCPVLTVRQPEHEFAWPDTLAVVEKAM